MFDNTRNANKNGLILPKNTAIPVINQTEPLPNPIINSDTDIVR